MVYKSRLYKKVPSTPTREVIIFASFSLFPSCVSCWGESVCLTSPPLVDMPHGLFRPNTGSGSASVQAPPSPSPSSRTGLHRGAIPESRVSPPIMDGCGGRFQYFTIKNNVTMKDLAPVLFRISGHAFRANSQKWNCWVKEEIMPAFLVGWGCNNRIP